MRITVRQRGEYGGAVEARIDDIVVGQLEFAADGFVESVTVNEHHRRQGIATAMLRAMPMSPSFSDQGNTSDGDAWITAMQQGGSA